LIVKLYSKIVADELPLGKKWIEYLSMLNGCYFSEFNKLKKIEDFYPITYDDIIQIGIKKDSKDYLKSIEILSSISKSPQHILIDNILLPGYCCIYVSKFRGEGYMAIEVEGTMVYEMTESARLAISKVISLYDKTPYLKEQVVQAFMNRLKKEPNLNNLFRWWNQIPVAPELTDVGILIANINARRLGVCVEKYKWYK
jgi:hypothetical protein